MLRIRLARGGAKKRPYYRIVVADGRAPRDGKFLERVGTYAPLKASDAADRVTLNEERIRHWLSCGAQPSERVRRFLDAASILALPERLRGENLAKARALREAARAVKGEGSGEEGSSSESLAEEVKEGGKGKEEAKAAKKEEPEEEKAAKKEEPVEEKAVKEGKEEEKKEGEE